MTDFKVPGAIYHFALSPKVSSHGKEVGWPEPTCRRMGRGWQYVYRDATPELIHDLVEWVRTCAEGIIAGSPSGENRDARDALTWTRRWL